ncbi:MULTISPECIES: Lsr2 family protein [unclassified Curtobacterium]|uniref:histone-like nucleoid-structuring protein Lsr2 n=1 Tax=unclassified Curtobacterium TaxID=257496 RepID=UPI0008DEA3CD|nr:MULTISPECIES: Lsr2 family protein [unclassified Curtobacterium]OIH99752.1 lysylphosphatidylglycerol synthetase [Curtobacterium sp. MCBA15_003]OII30411.1 lysylphosphatidylglycerol synthetase [Curtobacterium sp. MMLR14_006]
MAQKVTTQLVDDLSDEVIEQGKGRTVQFAFDGSFYEIDLTDDNAEKLREVFSDYVAAARKVSGARAGRGATSSAAKDRNSADELARIREWAAANGYEVAARGRIRQQVRDAYAAAN